MQQKIISLLLAFICLPELLMAEDDEWYLNKPILDIQFEGLDNISENDLQGVIEPFLDQPFTEPLLLDIQRRLYNLEYFELIVPEALPENQSKTRMILKFTVEERSVISEIRFEGNKKVHREALKNEIVLKKGDFISRSQTRLDQNAIVSLYHDKGFANVQVDFSIVDTPNSNDNVQILVFTIEEGFQTNVRDIFFSGISFATENRLKSVLTTKKQGLLNPGAFKSYSLELDRQAILQYYGENGYVDAQVLDIEQNLVLDEEKNRQFLELTYYIDEGDAWFFGDISFVGHTIFKDEKLHSNLKLNTGDVLNSLKLQAGLQQIASLYHQNGYIFTQINIQEERDEALRQINYVMTIVEKSRAYIENIIIRGNTKTKDKVIYRELPFEEGDVFSGAKIRDGILNLYNTQYFADLAAVDTPQGSVPGLMDLIFTLKEQQTTDLRLGFSVGVGEDVPLSGLLQWYDNNFLGNGQTIGANMSIGHESQLLSVNFHDDWFFGKRWGAGLQFSLNRTVRSDYLQDVLYPYFDKNDENAVPDPYHGYYVFNKDTNYNGIDYKAGDIFPDDPSADNIEKYNLLTDYQYAGGSTSVTDQYRMEYVKWTIGASILSNVRRQTLLGWTGIQASLHFAVDKIVYDDSYYRPFNHDIRENLNTFKLTNTFGLDLSLDNRDVFFNPQTGYLIEQKFRFTGGLLSGAQNFIRSDTTFQGYLKLINAKVTDAYTFKIILAFNSTLSLMLPQFDPYQNKTTFTGSKHLLTTNSMTIARGWPIKRDLLGLWNNWIELRLPLNENILWLDFFFEAVRYVESTHGYNKANTMSKQLFAEGTGNWLYGFGGGLRFSIPQFPFRIYLAKLYKVDDTSGTPQVNWHPGNVFQNKNDSKSGLSLIFAVSLF